MKHVNRTITILVFIFLYIPMIVLAVASFNTGTDIASFKGFTLRQYANLFRDGTLLTLLRNSVIIALLATLISTIVGTMAAVGIHGMKGRLRSAVMTMTNIPMTNPDIVTGVALALLFAFAGTVLKTNSVLGFWTLLIAHITFNLPYVILNVMPKLQQMDKDLVEAALDLGCTPMQAFTKVVIHEIMPGIISGALMAFTMSHFLFRQFFFFFYGDVRDLQLHEKAHPAEDLCTLYAHVHRDPGPDGRHEPAAGEVREKPPAAEEGPRMKKRVFSLLLALTLLLCALPLPVHAAANEITVYNWGQYISDGTDESLDVIQAFEEETGIKVNYLTFDSNESMYTKLKTGGTTFDVIIPSDYMIAKLISEDMLEPLDFANIPNYEYIDEAFRDQAYDPQNAYSVPYTWGTVGLIYNKNYVSEEDAQSWSCLWNSKYQGKLLMFDNPRDAFAIAESMLGYSFNTEDEQEFKNCADLLATQSPVLQGYVMDQIFDRMERGEAWAAPYYAGDYLTMVEENPDLGFSHPKEGFNIFIDAMCIPKGCQNKAGAEAFINFLCRPDISAANLDYIGYSTPETAAKEYLDEEVISSPVSYPDDETLARSESFAELGVEATQTMNDLWLSVKTSTANTTTYLILTLVAIAAVAAFFIISGIVKRRKKARRCRKWKQA